MQKHPKILKKIRRIWTDYCKAMSEAELIVKNFIHSKESKGGKILIGSIELHVFSV